ncbi:ISAs1 family transposase [Streptomyces olivoreticuli]|nr:ISAs1 family transposase [Streptomyces olivoreticuli]WKK23409.1 ISAs1 family transposase [Streptomyces olivoreticuli]WKK23986.1 ISAs1 family transposase [Streptomyces olivoreticuli]WKK24181.1 ISAs1 family transposase [Streptomyces olivoreticuli]WKK24248.1 ISAs1 family transposase [Streptomyces olivoreticuli]WKK24333.1 ISAs1 family transposase [Streptomyces olivoreticuli]
MCRQSATTVCLVKSPSREHRELPGPAARLAVLPDPRDRRGRRHTLASVLLTAACAVLAGARSYLAIGQWARHAPQDTLARLGFRARGPLGVRLPASASTVRRVLVLVCPGGLADLLGHGPAGTESVAVDGKSARGSRTDTVPAAHLLSAVTAAGRTVSQLRVPDKTNEITAFTALLAPFDLAGAVVTADALHTQREHAKWLVEVKHAHYLLVVKGNQPKLHAALKSLPWKEVTARRYDRERGHGRHETRSVRMLTVTGLALDFPHVVQAVKILRHRTETKTGRVTRQTVYAITDMPAREASPQLIGRLARSQWGIEAVHHIRDTTFTEDASTIRTGHGPENMATLRNLAINTLRDTGCRNIAAGLREVSYTPFTRPLDLLQLP